MPLSREQKKTIWMASSVGGIAVIALVVAFLSLAGDMDDRARDVTDDINECIRKGESYFQEIGSYPRLSDGRYAPEVAKERCLRTTGAFDSHF